jgi:hypothetical protein
LKRKAGKAHKSEIKPGKPAETLAAEKFIFKYGGWLAIAAVLIIAAIIRIRLLEIPLERDEGEFAYMGQLILNGVPPYLLAYNVKLPGIYLAYALMMALFGQTTAGVHLGLLVVNTASIVLTFLLTRRLFGTVAGVVAAAGYAFLSLSPSALGTSAHATQYIVPFVLGGTLLLLTAIESGKYRLIIMSGLLYGLAFTVKQHAAFFILFAVAFLAWNRIQARPADWKKMACETALLVLSSALPFAMACIWLYHAGVFPRFWFWTFTYASQYVSIVPWSDGWRIFQLKAPIAIGPWVWLWCLAGIGLSAIFWNKTVRSQAVFLTGFALVSFLSICPGFYFREHYFVLMLPAVSVLAGAAASAGRDFLAAREMPAAVQWIPLFIVMLAILIPVVKFGGFFFRATPVEAGRMMYALNPFPESVEIAEYIRKHTTGDDRIAVIGSEPQIYFYSRRKSATGYLYVYGLMEPHAFASKMQLDMIQQIESARPKYMIVVDVKESWGRWEKSDLTIRRWTERYIAENYRLAGIADIITENYYPVYWDDDARKYKPKARNNVYVFERKTL